MNFSRASYLWLCGVLSCSVLSGCTDSSRDSTSKVSETPPTIAAASGTVELIGKDGRGNAFFTPIANNKLQLTVKASGLVPGIYKLGIAKYNSGCSQTYLSEGYTTLVELYQKPGRTDLPATGDLSGIKINSDGAGATSQITDNITVKDLSNSEGSVLVVYESKSKQVPKTAEELRKDSRESYKIVNYDEYLLCGVISSGTKA